MPRFFIEGISPKPGDRITLSEEDSRHVSLSLRMKRGDALTLCDGVGTDFGCVAVDFAGAVTVEVVSSSPSAGEPPYRATVFQAEIKGDKFDTVIQKAVELGAAGIVPFTSSRCVCRPDARDADKKKKRRERIALEAHELCFIDDLEINCAAARECGWQAVCFKDNRQAADDLERMLK